MHNDITPSHDDQRVVVDQVLSTMADLHLLPIQPVDEASFFSQQPLASLIRYTPPINQLLILQCSQTLALRLTASFFDRPLPTSSCDADVADTMTELVNMIGGNLKGLMPDETSIGVPWMLAQGERLDNIDGQLSQAWFTTAAGVMRLTFTRTACS